MAGFGGYPYGSGYPRGPQPYPGAPGFVVAPYDQYGQPFYPPGMRMYPQQMMRAPYPSPAPVSMSKYFSIDVECIATGKGHNDRAVAQIALVDQSERVLMNAIVRSPVPVASYMTPLTGLTAEMMENGISFEEAMAHLRQLLPPYAVLVGQNIAADIRWLGLREGYDFEGLIDLSGAYRVFNPKFSSFSYFSLQHEARVLLGTNMEGPHNAVTDASVSIQLFKKYLQLNENKAEMDSARQALLALPPEPSFAKKNPSFEGVCMGNRVPRSKRIESADYTIINNPLTRVYASKDYRYVRRKRGFLRWTMFFLMGVLAAGMYRVIFLAIEAINEKKFDLLEQKIQDDDTGNAFATYFVIMIVCVMGAMLIVLWAPLAGGGGVPEVICALNGTWEEGLFTFKTLFAKIFALILAVGSGLALGPEGPFIHLGAILGPVTVSICMKILGNFTKLRFPAKDLTQKAEERNFVVVGAAVGVAVAFRAPIGGVLFVLEEAVSFFDARLIFRVYFSCAVAYYALQIMFQGHHLVTTAFTEYDVQVHCDIGYVAEDLILFALLGVLGGALGALFNQIVVFCARLRTKYVYKYGYRRMIDAAVICLLTSLCVVYIPLQFHCAPASQIVSHIPNFDAVVAAEGNHSLFPTSEQCLSDTAWAYFRTHQANLTDINQFYKESYLSTVTCAPTEYNEMASLMQASGRDMVSLLFSNGVYNMLSLWSLVLFMLIYFLLAAITASLSVPAGMVVPSLIIGGCMGRIAALLINMSFKTWLGAQFVDPGSWAMVGAAAFWCGSARITVTIAVIIMEITGDFRYIPALAITVMFARLTGQFFTDSVYHMIIHIKKIMFLEDIPVKVMDNIFVEDIMVSASVNIVHVPVEVEESTLTSVLSTTHNGFPVTEVRGGKERVAGLITREQIYQALASEARYEGKINLKNFMNETPITVLPSFTMAQAFKMFRTLGLRHLIVVDEDYQLVGLLTRECFMESYKPLRPDAEDSLLGDEEYEVVDPEEETRLSRARRKPSAGTPLLRNNNDSDEYMDVEEASKVV